MTIEELREKKAPFRVISKHDGHTLVVTGFAHNDPLNVGGGLLPMLATVYFEGGGWLLVRDLLRHYDIDPPAS